MNLLLCVVFGPRNECIRPFLELLAAVSGDPQQLCDDNDWNRNCEFVDEIEPLLVLEVIQQLRCYLLYLGLVLPYRSRLESFVDKPPKAVVFRWVCCDHRLQHRHIITTAIRGFIVLPCAISCERIMIFENVVYVFVSEHVPCFPSFVVTNGSFLTHLSIPFERRELSVAASNGFRCLTHSND